jgi:phosphate-selective porin OprO/OprP
MMSALMIPVSPGQAQNQPAINAQMDQLQQQIHQLQQQLEALQAQIRATQEQAQQSQQAVQKVQTDTANSPKVTMSPSGRPGISSADGRNTIELTSRLHFDVGDYLKVERPAGSALSSGLTSGVNARRARIGALGKFMEDWNYTLIFDLGGSSDAYPPTTGALASGIENAFITYNGFRPFAIDLGYMAVPWTLDEATSTNDLMFLERASSQVVATAFGGGDFRSAFGVRWTDNRAWAGAYVTGPTSGSTHTSSNSEQLAGLLRFTYQVLQTDDYALHLGVNGADLFVPRSSTTNAHTLTLTDRPELRVDPTAFLSTGPINANGGYVLGAEAAAAYGNFFAQGEYFRYWVDQFSTAGSTTPTPKLDFDGGYAQASYTLGGRRKYIPDRAAYSGVIPDRPLATSLSGFSGGWGALELAARYSYVNLNDKVISGVPQSTTGGVFGGKQNVYTVGANWYVNNNIRFMLNYLHAKVDKLDTTGNIPQGVKIDAIAARTQVAF